jgi:hypothetical protein
MLTAIGLLGRRLQRYYGLVVDSLLRAHLQKHQKRNKQARYQTHQAP